MYSASLLKISSQKIIKHHAGLQLTLLKETHTIACSTKPSGRDKDVKLQSETAANLTWSCDATTKVFFGVMLQIYISPGRHVWGLINLPAIAIRYAVDVFKFNLFIMRICLRFLGFKWESSDTHKKLCAVTECFMFDLSIYTTWFSILFFQLHLSDHLQHLYYTVQFMLNLWHMIMTRQMAVLCTQKSHNFILNHLTYSEWMIVLCYSLGNTGHLCIRHCMNIW